MAEEGERGGMNPHRPNGRSGGLRRGAALGAAALVVAGAWSSPVAADPSYRAKVFHESACPPAPLGDRFFCLEDLIDSMGAAGLKFYRSEVPSLTAGPDGIVAADDVVILKINYQWEERGGTNVDLLRGLVRRILAHPDSFTGEVVVCENAQFASTSGFDRARNNAQDPSLSPRDVVLHFQAQGERVSAYDWTLVRGQAVGEYSDGDLADGYVVGPYLAQLGGRVSYPKFRTTHGTQISLKLGIWSETTGYDRKRLKILNLPVLKSHHAVYGATAAVKNYMGVVTTALSTNSHAAVGTGLLGAVAGEVGLPDLNILDAIWINANPYNGPATSYSGATRADRLVASRDPVALDLWAVTNILVPAFVANGYSPPWPAPSADPTLATGAFRNYLDRSTSLLRSAGIDVTNDLGSVDVVATGPPGEASDPTGSGAPFTVSKHPGGFELAWSSPVRGDAVGSYLLLSVPIAGLSQGAAPACAASLGSGTAAVLPALADDVALVVAARNAAGEGTLGRDSRGRDRRGPQTTLCP